MKCLLQHRGNINNFDRRVRHKAESVWNIPQSQLLAMPWEWVSVCWDFFIFLNAALSQHNREATSFLVFVDLTEMSRWPLPPHLLCHALFLATLKNSSVFDNYNVHYYTRALVLQIYIDHICLHSLWCKFCMPCLKIGPQLVASVTAATLH